MKKSKDPKSSASQGAGAARSMNATTPTVLHIDDDPNDSELLEAALRKAAAGFTLHTVADGEEAMAYLNGQGRYADRTRFRIPSLVLLDLKMPRATGFEVLKWIRGHTLFGNVPVIILSGSQCKDDVNAAYSAGANSYLVKPLGFAELVKLVKEIKSSWLSSHIRPATGQAHLLRVQENP